MMFGRGWHRFEWQLLSVGKIIISKMSDKMKLTFDEPNEKQIEEKLQEGKKKKIQSELF